MKKTVVVFGLFFLVAGCAGQTDIATISQRGVGEDEGTALSVSLEASDPVCNGASGTVTLSGTLTTTGSVDSVVVTVSDNGGDAMQIGTIQPQDFSNGGGRIKEAEFSYDVTLSDGTHSLTVCFTQSGSQGREPKEVCETREVVVDCAEDCGGVEFFGDIVGNPSLCNGNGTNNVPVHVRGDLGDAPTLTVSGPGGFSFDVTMRRAGDSCNYHHNWATRGGNHGGAGTYTFSVSGPDGSGGSFDADLSCGR